MTGARSLLLVCVDLDTGVTGAMVGEGGARHGEAIRVLVEQDIALVLDEPAGLEDAVHLSPSARTTLELDAGLGETRTKRISGLPSKIKKSVKRDRLQGNDNLRMVVRNLAGDVVENVSLGDTVSGSGTNPTHDAAEIAKEVTVEGSQSATREGELGCAVVGENGVGVLEERDHDEPVVHPATRSVFNGQCQRTLQTYQR